MTAAEWARWLLIVGGFLFACCAAWAVNKTDSASPYADVRKEDR